MVFSSCYAHAESVPKTMKRLVLVKKGKEATDAEFAVETVPVPKPKHGEVLVRMAAAPVNPSDFYFWKGAEGEKQGEPEVIGREGSGVVVANGGGMKGWSLVGKSVAIAAFSLGTYQEYFCVASDMVVETARGVPVEDSCSAYVNPYTVVGIAETAKEYGSPNFIHTAGASALGLMMVRGSAELGIKVVCIVRREEQVAALKKIGAQYIVNISNDNWKEQLSKYIEELNISVAFDAIGGPLTGDIVGLLPANSHHFNYGFLDSEPVGNIVTTDLLFNTKNIHGWLFLSWLNAGGSFSVMMRARRVAGMVMPNLARGKWASSEFKDCTMESMKTELAAAFRNGFTGLKLRIRF